MSKKKKNKPYFVKGDRYSIEDTFSILVPYLDPNGGNKEKVDFYGDRIKPNSQRYQTFYYKGCTCVKCGLKASYFEKDRMSNETSYHLNLYGVDSQGNEVMFTKDHILPKSKGGKDYITNYQPMCERCNVNKSSTMTVKDRIHTAISKQKTIKKLMVNHYKKHPAYKMQKAN